ncbi:MAG: DUF4249 domain-containing protein [Flavobacteriales bacterium]|nr:DUF4249 domain-containing protein [Flavobacteriales bacterium]
MKRFKNQILFSSLVSLLLLSSCTEVIDIELNEAERRYVVEGAVVEGTDSAYVLLTKTTSFFDTTSPETENDAQVYLTMPDGSEVQLPYVADGKYVAHGLSLSNASNYSIRVEVDDQTFTAQDYMMPAVVLDSLEYEFDEGLFGGEDGYNIFLNFMDQPGKNFYRVIYTVDGELQNTADDIMVFDDNLNDGVLIRIPIFTYSFAAGDSVDIELQSLSPELYEFYQTFASVASEDAGSPFAAAPANPVSNVEGGALGVFGAYTSSKKSIVIPE